jgi:hypothetical protein
MSLLKVRIELELSQALLHGLISSQLGRVDLPVRLLRFSLGRLQRGELRQFELSQNRCTAEARFASGPAVRLQVQTLGFSPENRADDPLSGQAKPVHQAVDPLSGQAKPVHRALRLRVEHLHFSGFRGGPLLNLMPGKVLEVLAAQANRRLPGLLRVRRGMEIELHLQPLIQRALQEASFRQSIEAMGLEISPQVQLEHLELREHLLRLTLSAAG